MLSVSAFHTVRAQLATSLYISWGEAVPLQQHRQGAATVKKQCICCADSLHVEVTTQQPQQSMATMHRSGAMELGQALPLQSHAALVPVPMLGY